MPHHSLTASTAAKIGQYIKYQREKRKLSLNEFANSVGVTPSFLLRLEQGVYQTVKLSAIEKIAVGFQMGVIDLLTKCQLGEEYVSDLPPLEYYLKEKYQFPPEAVADVNLLVSMLQQKYKTEIATMKKKHHAYWKKKSED